VTDDDVAELNRLSDWFNRILISTLGSRKRIADLEARIAELEAGGTGPELPTVPFTTPPLLRNAGSWDDYPDAPLGRHRVREDGSLEITLGQKAGREERAERVVRHDFGISDPKAPNNFLREPMDTPRRYAVKVTVESLDTEDKVNLWQIHSGLKKRPPYLSFLAWGGVTRWRHDTGNGVRTDHAKRPLEVGYTYQLRVEAVWSKGPKGFVRAWQGEDQVIDYQGATVPDDDEAGYLIVGPYFPGTPEAFKAAFRFEDLIIGDG
jgi:hypothetical protein